MKMNCLAIGGGMIIGALMAIFNQKRAHIGTCTALAIGIILFLIGISI